MVKPSSISWFQTPDKGAKDPLENDPVVLQNNRRNYYPLESLEKSDKEVGANSEELPVTMDIQDTDQANSTSKAAEELNLVNPEKLAYILIGVCCGLSILCLIVVAISIGYNKSETQYRFSSGAGGVKVSKSIKLIKASNSDMKSNSSSNCSTSSSGSTSEAEEVDTEGQHSPQVIVIIYTKIIIPLTV